MGVTLPYGDICHMPHHPHLLCTVTGVAIVTVNVVLKEELVYFGEMEVNGNRDYAMIMRCVHLWVHYYFRNVSERLEGKQTNQRAELIVNNIVTVDNHCYCSCSQLLEH